MNRRLALAGIVVVLLVTGAVPAARADEALEEYLEDASAADFHGEGIVLCKWGEDHSAARYSVTRSQGMTMVNGSDGTLMIEDGITAMQSGADWYGLEVEEWSEWSLSDRYSVAEPEETSVMGREALVITVLEDGRTRARLTLDRDSAVPLMTEIFDAEGAIFRTAALVDFDPGVRTMATVMPEVHETDLMVHAGDAGDLPAAAAGYRRADVYAMGDTILQAFYTDGLFSFSVFETERGDRPDVFDTATRFEVNGETYRRIVMPSAIWVHWNAPDRTYVLVGDLPPDHLTDVLQDLPEPGDRALLVRLWRRLFG